ncbi:MAG: HAMP domain-containing histidine kinase [Actinobacteria bacterium]|nr:HAMP domain-containing histidine kinase [Actinomycetota bacterium]
MNPFRSVGALLSIALSLVVVGALVIVYLMVVPSLQNRLIDSKLSQFERVAPSLQRQFESVQARPGNPIIDFLEEAKSKVNADRAVSLSSSTPDLLYVQEDTQQDRKPSSSDAGSDRIALRAFQSGEITEGTAFHGGKRFAEVAIPSRAPVGFVLLVRSNLESQYQTIHVVKRRLLIAGLVGLMVALGVGYGGAWAFARRIRRLERAAERISAGQFDEPVVDESLDELGELARAFDRMRLRLAQLDGARREFIANASHELRTPLFSLGGFLELMDDEDLDDETRREFLTAMREQVARLTRLATDLLDLSRLDAGRIRLDREAFDLEPLAHTVAEEFSPVALANDHALEVAPGDSSARALGDPERVLQIGRLLVENAIVHTPPGTPVRLRVTGEDGRAVLSVEDEGPGIPEGHAGQVFERFYRAEGGRTSGSGLGLAIARELAVLMGGTIEVDSRPGKTVFSLSLPAPGDGDRAERKFPRGTLLTK